MGRTCTREVALASLPSAFDGSLTTSTEIKVNAPSSQYAFYLNKSNIVTHKMSGRPTLGKRPSSHNKGVSPPPSKRRQQSTTTSKRTCFTQHYTRLTCDRQGCGQLLYPRIQKGT